MRSWSLSCSRPCTTQVEWQWESYYDHTPVVNEAVVSRVSSAGRCWFYQYLPQPQSDCLPHWGRKWKWGRASQERHTPPAGAVCHTGGAQGCQQSHHGSTVTYTPFNLRFVRYIRDVILVVLSPVYMAFSGLSVETRERRLRFLNRAIRKQFPECRDLKTPESLSPCRWEKYNILETDTHTH